MALNLVITNAGRAALINAENTGTSAVVVASVGVSPTEIVPGPGIAVLPGEVKRITTIGGDAVAADMIHVLVSDETADTYSVRSIALYLADGTLFGCYGQPAVIVEKSAGAVMLLAIDVTLQDVSAAAITFGDTDFINPPATTERAGAVELATLAEVQAGNDNQRAVTPYTLAVRFGDVWRASNDGAGSGLDADLLDGQQGSWYADVAGRLGFTPVRQGGGAGQNDNTIRIGWDSTRLKGQVDGLDLGPFVFDSNIANVWRSNNDGAGSGLDADLLDGRHASDFAPKVDPTFIGTVRAQYLVVDGSEPGALFIDDQTNAGKGWEFNSIGGTLRFRSYSHGDLVTITPGGASNFNTGLTVYGNTVWHAGNDGSGSGSDADLLDGQQGSWYADIPSRLGFIPVQQGTGWGQQSNTVKIGWSASSRVKVTVDATDMGNVVFDQHISDVWRSSNDGAGSGLDADLLDGWHRDDVRHWNNLLGKPDAFPPVAHGHSWDQIGDKPGSFPPAPHGHSASEINFGTTDENTLSVGGKVMKWGSVSFASGPGTYAINFPTPFPNECQSVVMMAHNLNGSNQRDSWPQLLARDAYHFDYVHQTSQTGGSTSLDGFEWIAFGR